MNLGITFSIDSVAQADVLIESLQDLIDFYDEVPPDEFPDADLKIGIAQGMLDQIALSKDLMETLGDK